MNKAAIRVLVSDDNPLFRQGIQTLFSNAQDLHVVDEATDGSETVSKAGAHQPDVLLLDINIPGIRSFDVARAVRRVSPLSRVLFLTEVDENERVQAAISECANGCIRKSAPPHSILSAIREAPGGSPVLTRQGFERLFDDLQTLSSKVNERRVDPKTLTHREQEVLSMIVRGCTAREIAEHYRLSTKTVEAHKFNLMRKLDVHSRGDLIDLALSQRLVPALDPL